MALSDSDIFGDSDAGTVPVASSASHAEREWNKLHAEFTNAGFREGAIAGKEAALQDGFDDGFASTGAPAGRALGLLRGQAAAALAIVTKHGPAEFEGELRDIVSALSNVRLHDVVQLDDAAPRTGANAELLEVQPSAQLEMDQLEATLGQLGNTPTAASRDPIAELRTRLAAALNQLGLPLDV
ncbi:hypothetical protein AURDEDRAFT_186862 [Auricularia subglabra TFB-10046 SS5]|uniref:Protein YAE1 n=1 Tax=Auricularia subglabra (strain TFB-10046 / SS5) TaxID=717982 RepID=J0LJV5_AURST|nr:hypothetical protein AURDEDRAFT_186862 [Auricularia subglabra TFB-10046 SS5]